MEAGDRVEAGEMTMWRLRLGTVWRLEAGDRGEAGGRVEAGEMTVWRLVR